MTVIVLFYFCRGNAEFRPPRVEIPDRPAKHRRGSPRAVQRLHSVLLLDRYKQSCVLSSIVTSRSAQKAPDTKGREADKFRR